MDLLDRKVLSEQPVRKATRDRRETLDCPAHREMSARQEHKEEQAHKARRAGSGRKASAAPKGIWRAGVSRQLGTQGPQGSIVSSFAYVSNFSTQTVAAGTNIPSTSQAITFDTQGPLKGVTFTGSNTLTLPTTGTYSATYNVVEAISPWRYCKDFYSRDRLRSDRLRWEVVSDFSCKRRLGWHCSQQ